MKLPDPEEAAARLHSQVGPISPPVDLHRIAGLWSGLRISTESLDGEGYLVDLGSRGGEIIVRAHSTLPRQRYTIAHELGHWVLRARGDRSEGSAATQTGPAAEKWCDRFAAGLLMPRAWVVRHLRSARSAGLVSAVLSGPEIFSVSEQAFRLRVAETTSISIFEVQQRDGRLDVEKEFISPTAETGPLTMTLLRVTDLIPGAGDRGMYLDPDTRFRSHHRLLSSPGDVRRWLVCMMPAGEFDD